MNFYIMIDRKLEITNQLGLHARAAAKLVTTASRHESKVEIEKDNRRVDAKSIMAVMMLAASCGTQVTIYAHGEDELEAIEAITKLILDKFDEEQ